MKSFSERCLGLDVLRSIAAFVVVLIHTPVSTGNSIKSLLLDLSPSANAVFAVMAGLFLAEKLRGELVFSEWLKLRTKRLAAPYLFWVLVYLCLNIGFDMLRGNKPNYDFHSLKWWAGVIFCGAESIQLWFVVTLFYSQVILFLVWYFVHKISSKPGYSFIVFCLGFVVININPYIPDGLFLRHLTFMTGYLLMGVFINELHPFLIKNRKIVLWSGLGLLVASYIVILCRFALPYNLWVFKNILWVVVARYLMVLRVPGFVLSMGRYSMFIYLVHIVFTTLIPLICSEVGIASADGFSFLYVTFSAFVLSWYSAILLSRFKRFDFFRKHIAFWLGV